MVIFKASRRLYSLAAAREKKKIQRRVQNLKKKRINLSLWGHFQEITGQSHLAPAPHPSLISRRKTIMGKKYQEKIPQSLHNACPYVMSVACLVCHAPTPALFQAPARWDRPLLPQVGPSGICAVCIFKRI